MLDPVPPEPIQGGTPAFGTYAGRCADTNLRLGKRRVSLLGRVHSEKRWQWFAAFDDHIAVGGAIVDAGLFGTAFLWVFDRTAGALLVDADVVLPSVLTTVSRKPTEGLIASVAVPRYRLKMSRTGSTMTVAGRFGGTAVDLDLAVDDDVATTAICPVPERDGGVNVTQKEPGVAVTGSVDTARGDGDATTDWTGDGDAANGGEATRSEPPFDIDGVGFVDYSHGLLGRETAWDWAFGHTTAPDGTAVGFNLVDRFNEGYENVVWVDGEAEAVGAARLDSNGDEWHVRTECGTVDAALTVEGRRSQDIDIGIVRSQYDQPLGRWSGTVAGYEATGVGVAEEHRTRW